MRRHRLLVAERGSAPLEAIFAIVLVLLLALGVVQMALVVYARNVVASSAHEGARAAIEIGRTPEEATAIATRTIARAAGDIVHGLDVEVTTARVDRKFVVRVRVSGALKTLGPAPIPVPVALSASSAREVPPR